VRLGKLHFQICPWVHDPVLWNGNLSASLIDSPHVDFLKLRIEKGKRQALKQLYNTRYCQMYEYWDWCEYGLGGRTPKYIKRKASNLLELFDSIRKRGFDKSSRVQVLDFPLWNSRGFSGGKHLLAPEIFHGHHRVACLYVLGIKKVGVDICQDIIEGSLKWVQRLNLRKGLRDDG